MFQYKFYRVSSEIDRTVIHVFGTFRNVQVEMTLAAECIEFFAFDVDVIWAVGCADFKIHDF